MAQETLVLVVPKAQHSALRERLAAQAFEFRPVPHALFSVKGHDVVATLYASGKLVVQGRDPAVFVGRFLEGAELPAPATKEGKGPMRTLEVPTVGSDECGKGDYFGPLVVAAVRLEPAQARELVASGVMDSKRLTDTKALQLGAAIRHLPHAVRRLDPPEYNRRHTAAGNLNVLLAELHCEVIRELADRGMRVVVDRFADERLIASRVKDLALELEQRPRAEDDPAVAAASILARSEFLLALKELGEEHDTTLPKGAGPPVDVAARKLYTRGGHKLLGVLAKLHFKNTSKLHAPKA